MIITAYIIGICVVIIALAVIGFGLALIYAMYKDFRTFKHTANEIVTNVLTTIGVLILGTGLLGLSIFLVKSIPYN